MYWYKFSEQSGNHKSCERVRGKTGDQQSDQGYSGKILLRNGADEVIYPDKDIAEKWAERYSLDNLFDYIDLPGAFGIYEVPPLKEWVGKSIRESDIAAKHKISILGIKKKHEEEMSVMPSADYIIRETDHLMVMAGNEVAENLLKQNRNKFATPSWRK